MQFGFMQLAIKIEIKSGFMKEAVHTVDMETARDGMLRVRCGGQ